MDRDEIAALDREAFRLARGQERLRLVVGEALERLLRKQHHRKKGFRNLRAYAAERCGKSATWAGESRTLARRLAKRARIREALRLGKIGWSMAVVLARRATDEDEAELVELGRSRSVQVVKELLKERGAEPEPPGEERWATLSLSATREDAAVLEATRLLVRHLDGEESKDGWLEALLAEGQTSMIARGPPGVDVLGEDLFARYQAWIAQRALHDIRRSMAEERAEPAVLAQREEREGEADEEMPEDLDELDRQLGVWCRELASRELFLGRVLVPFLTMRGWEALGYASERQYAEERLGFSRSTMLGLTSLARRTEGLEAVREAFARGELGTEAARLIAGIADPDTEAAWVERARRRTFKHLREDVQAMELVGRVSGDARGLLPPSDEDLEAVQAFERDVITGALIRRVLGLPPAPAAPVQAGATSSASPSDPAVQICAHSGSQSSADATAGVPAVQICAHSGSAAVVAEGELCRGDPVLETSAQPGRSPLAEATPPLGDDAADVGGGDGVVDQKAAGTAGLGRVSVRYPIREALLVQWRALERAWEQCEAPGTFVEWLCFSFWSEWVRDTGQPMKWGDVYARDLYRCTSLICFGRDPTPHHLLFRSKGGTDELENLSGVCAWCHLEGVHAIGSVEALPPASNMTWRFGRKPWLEVVGRESRRL